MDSRIDVDLRHLACPGPVMKVKELLEQGHAHLRLRVADELARSNVQRFAVSRGARAVTEAAADGSFVVLLDADQPACPVAGELIDPSAGEHPRPQEGSDAGPVVIQITGETMGHGDPELGALLLRGFLKSQLDVPRRADLMIFYNSGVKLCCEGSPVLEDLRALAGAGIEIIACGTCLNYFGLADRLAVGRVTDMLEIAGKLAGAGTIVRP